QAVTNTTAAVVPPVSPTPAPTTATVIPFVRPVEVPPQAEPRPSAPAEVPAGSVPDLAPPSTGRSLLGLSAELDPLRSVGADASGAAERAARAALDLKLVDSPLTRPGEGAFRIVVHKADEPALMVLHGIPDQDFEPESRISFKVPADAFVHTRSSSVIMLHATRADGK